MRIKYHLLLLLCTIAVITASAQNIQRSSLDIADPAPSLHVKEWIKGKPILRMEKGHIYVLEFWATWCKPCIATTLHLSALASKYKDNITIIGIDVYEDKNTSVEQIRAFVENMGDRMDYHVAIDDGKQMVDAWIGAAEEKDNGIPLTFVVDAQGRLAWIGHPDHLDTVLQKMLNNSWDINDVAEKRNERRHLNILEEEANDFIWQYSYDRPKLAGVEKADSILLVVSTLIEKEPKLKNTYTIVYNTFSSLLQIDQKKAYDYGKSVLGSAYSGRYSLYYSIIEVIKSHADTLNLLPEIYHLGAEARQKEIDGIVYPGLSNMHNYYKNMAKWYWRANDKLKAIASQEKAIEALKDKNDFSTSALTALQKQLQQYKEQ